MMNPFKRRPKGMRFPNGIPRTELHVSEEQGTFTVTSRNGVSVYSLDSLEVIAQTGEHGDDE